MPRLLTDMLLRWLRRSCDLKACERCLVVPPRLARRTDLAADLPTRRVLDLVALASTNGDLTAVMAAEPTSTLAKLALWPPRTLSPTRVLNAALALLFEYDLAILRASSREYPRLLSALAYRPRWKTRSTRLLSSLVGTFDVTPPCIRLESLLSTALRLLARDVLRPFLYVL